jgi:hypothetical protein
VAGPRIAAEDYLTDDDLIMGGVEHEWVRVPAYKDGHRVSRDGTTAICGRPLTISTEFYESFSSAFKRIFNKDLPEWYVAHDRRKGSKCAGCKRDDPFDLVDPMAPEPVARQEHVFTPHPTVPDRMEEARLRSKVGMVSRILDVEPVL